MDFTVADLIKRAGGPDQISAASNETADPVTAGAVHKWRVNGIPEVHWSLFMRATGATADLIYQANERLRKTKAQRGQSCAA